MKRKIILFAILIYCFSNAHAQVANEKFNVGLQFQAGRIVQLGVEGEYILKPNGKYLNSLVGSITSNGMQLNTDFGNIIGTGFEIGFGKRKYLNTKGNLDKFYFDTRINYGSINFDKQLDYNKASFSANGNFTYLSILNATLGYKLLLKKIIVEPSLSVRYNIEIKGTGIVDTKDINNFLFNAGLKLGYSF
ncbi:hypothetical protein QM480_14045 [Flectobacillus sp. DC10W]|uniref:Outer membrane protein beta-barrel domain-containing protein n=1 Tax=Flectobacillus longus TaxID=2984207 RepID=A0ABT6YPD6_9BACT|nr:hypothetical protein [Flectobacillus longus]MDI9865459.1 hypothetical protein [Flectobacillus longus]